MPSFPWNVGDRAESNLSPGGFADSDSERSYATVGEVRAPQWVQWFTTLSSRQNPGPSRPRLNRIASEEPSQRSTVLSAGQASSPSGIGSLQEEEWSPDQVVWQGNEAPKAPKLYSPWHQHVQQNPISTTYGTSRWTQGSTTYGTPNRMQHRMPMQSSQSQETLLPEKVPKKKRDTDCMCLAVVTLLVFLTVLGTPLSLWLYFKFVVNEPIYGIDASMRITNWQFTDDLGQKGSGSFGNYSDSLCSELKDTFALGGTSLALDTCEISNFSNGSVVAEFKIGRYVVEGINENELKANLSQLLSEAVTTGKINGHRAMKSIEIDPSSLKFMDDDENECEIGDDLCAPHQCVNMLFDFMCQCQSGFIHQDDKKHACIRDERDIETTVTTTTVSSTTTAKITTEARPATNETDDCPEVKLSVHESSTTLRATCKSMDTSSNIEWLTSDKKTMTEVEDRVYIQKHNSWKKTLIIKNFTASAEDNYHCLSLTITIKNPKACVKYAYFDPMNYADYLEANNDDGSESEESEEDAQGSGEVEQESEEDAQGSGEVEQESEEDEQGSGEVEQESEEDEQGSGEVEQESEEDEQGSGEVEQESEEDEQWSGEVEQESEEDEQGSGEVEQESEEDEQGSGEVEQESEENEQVSGEVEQESEEDEQGSGEVEQESEEDKQGSGEVEQESEEDEQGSGEVEQESEEDEQGSGEVEQQSEEDKQGSGEVEQDSEEDKQGSGEVEQNSEEDKQGSGEMDVEDVAEGVTVTPILVTEENKESVEESEASGENLGNNGNPGNSENNGNSGNNGNNGNSGNNGNNGNSGNNGNNGNSENNGNNGNSENNGNS